MSRSGDVGLETLESGILIFTLERPLLGKRAASAPQISSRVTGVSLFERSAMAKEIVEPNFTQVPNVLLDGMSEFSDSEFRVLLVVCRQTFGYHRIKAVMSISYLAKGAGLSPRGVVNACATLEKKGYLEKETTDRFRGANAFRLVVIDPCTQCIGRAPDPCTQCTSTHAHSAQVPMHTVHTSKEMEIKEINGEPLHEARALLTNLLANGVPYKPVSKQQQRDVKMLRERLGSGETPESLSQTRESALQTPNGYWCSRIGTISLFAEHLEDCRKEIKNAKNGVTTRTSSYGRAPEANRNAGTLNNPNDYADIHVWPPEPKPQAVGIQNTGA